MQVIDQKIQVIVQKKFKSLSNNSSTKIMQVIDQKNVSYRPETQVIAKKRQVFEQTSKSHQPKKASTIKSSHRQSDCNATVLPDLYKKLYVAH